MFKFDMLCLYAVPEGNIGFRGQIMATDVSKCGAAVIQTPHRHTHSGVA